MANVHQLSADDNTIRVKGATMNERVTIYIDCEPRESLEEFGKRFYRCDVNPTNLANHVWKWDCVGYICPQRIDEDGRLVLFGFTDMPPLYTGIKNYSETLKSVNLGEI